MDKVTFPIPTVSSSIVRRKSRDIQVNTYGKSLAELCCGNEMIVLNGRTKGDYIGQFTCHTYNGASVVDYAIVSADILPSIGYFTVSDLTEFSHHCFISFALEVEPRLGGDKTETVKLLPLPTTFAWNEELRNILRESLNNNTVTNEMNSLFESLNDIDSLVTEFSGVLVRVSRNVAKIKNGHKPKKKRKNTIQKQKWFDTSCYLLKKELKNLGSLLTKYPTDPFLRHKFFSTKKEYKRLTRRLKRNFQSEMLNKIQLLEEHNPREFWKMVNSIKSSKSSGSVEDISPTMWYNYFKELNETKEPDQYSNEEHFVKNYQLWAVNSHEILDAPISLQEICSSAKKLKRNKASAGDSVSNEIIKIAVDVCAPHFVKLFNLILSGGVFPKKWAEGYVVPIYKSGGHFDPENYRGICISSCLGKFFTLILNSRFNTFLERYNILNECQIGFRRGFRTSDHILVLKTLIDSYKIQKRPLFACFIDFRKAYDSVWREGLFYKLIRYGCSKNFVRILLSMYSSVRVAVKLNAGVTPFFTSNIGLKQGCNLSPTLFNVFINDIPELFTPTACDPVHLGNTKVSCLLYADDLVLLSQSVSGLQESLVKLECFVKKWKLKVNLKKSKILIFGSKTQRRSYIASSWYFGGVALECVDEYVYLGITFHYTGGFKLARQRLCNKAMQAYHSIFRNFSNVNRVPVKVLLKLFSTLVSPILLYCCEIWGVYSLGRLTSTDMLRNKIFKVTSDIDKLHLKFCRRVLGVHPKSSSLAVLAELGRLPMSIQISTLVIKNWLRINSLEFKNQLVGKAAQWCIKSKYQGVKFSDFLLNMCNFESLSNHELLSNDINNLVKAIKHELCERYNKIWKDQIQQCNKLRLLSLVKPSPELESYLHTVKNVKHRQAVARFRISAHRFPVEVGRYANIEHKKRLCTICNSDDIGDEYHYFINCKNHKLENLRETFLKEILEINSGLTSLGKYELFRYCISMKDNNLINCTARYIYDLTKVFDDCIVNK